MKASVGIIKKLITVSAICFVLLALAACGEEPNAKFKNANVGDYITFGSYEQDNNTANGKEAIEWLVLAKDGDKALVISRFALDCQPFDPSDLEVTWETCSLRKWLNGTFINNAFSPEEQDIIQNSTVTADVNLEYSTLPCNDTTDKVFLLSITEAESYFHNDEERKCVPTYYAMAQGTWIKEGDVNCIWWLRSPGYSDLYYYATFVYVEGFTNSAPADLESVGVRPAMWIEL